MSSRAICLASVALLTTFFARSANAQESGSRPAGAVMASPDAPSAALRDLLAAACAHDETGFALFLTARNVESLSRLAPAARATVDGGCGRKLVLSGCADVARSNDDQAEAVAVALSAREL